MKKLSLVLALLCGVAPAFAQTTTVSGSKVLNGSAGLLSSGQWCLGATCETVTNGSFSGSVASATATVTVTNGSGTTYLTVPSVAVTGTSFLWDTFILGSSMSSSGMGTPQLACQGGATYAQTDNSNLPWYCVSLNGQNVWSISNGTTPMPKGRYAGNGVPNFTAVVPSDYTRSDASPQTAAFYTLVGLPGSASSNWVLQQGGGASSFSQLTGQATLSQLPTIPYSQTSGVAAASEPIGAAAQTTANTAVTNAAAAQTTANAAVANAMQKANNLSDVASPSAAAGNVATIIKTQTGCSTAGYVWQPQSNTCVAQSGGGSGTVNSGTANQIAYYPATGTAVSGTNALPNGTTATPGQTGSTVATNTDVAAVKPAVLTGPRYANNTSADTVETSAQAQATLGNPNGVQMFMDSFGGGTGATYNTGFAPPVAAAYGGPSSLQTKGGDQCGDMGVHSISQKADGIRDSIVECVINDIAQYNTNANLQTVFQRAWSFDQMVPMLVSAGTILGAQGMTKTGSPVADATFRNGWGEITTGTVTFTTTVVLPAANAPVYIGYNLFNGGTGTFTATIGGVSCVDPYTSSSTINSFGDGSATITTQNAVANFPALIRCSTALAAGSRTVVITTSSTGTNELLFAATTPTSFSTIPWDTAINAPPRTDANSALPPTYNALIASLASTFAGDGWPLKLYDLYTQITTSPSCGAAPYTACYSAGGTGLGTVHLSALGYAVDAAGLNALLASRQSGVNVVNSNLPFQQGPFQNSITSPAQDITLNSPVAPCAASATSLCEGLTLFDGGSGNQYSTRFVANTTGAYGGITELIPVSAGGIAWNVSTYGGSTTSTQGSYQPGQITSTPLAVAANGAVEFFPFVGGAVNARLPLQIQSSNLFINYNPTAGPAGIVDDNTLNYFFLDGRTATSSLNFNSTGPWLRGALWNGTASVFSDFRFVNIVGATANPTETISLQHANGGTGSLFADLTAATSGVRVASLLTAPVTVASSATPALVTTSGFETITLTSNAAPTFSGFLAGQTYTIRIIENATGGWTWTWPAAFVNALPINTAPNAITTETFTVMDGGGTLQFTGGGNGFFNSGTFNTYGTATNCSSSASPAVCGSAAAGAVVVAASATTVTVNTTAVTANSDIQLTSQTSTVMGTRLSVTCNTTASLGSVSAIVAGTSFTITTPAPTTNPECFSYTITN